MGKVLTLWGMNGNGKSCIAIHTAMEIAKRGHLVGILSCNTAFGGLQRLLGVSVNKEKSLANGLIKPQDHIIKECIIHVEKLDIFIISLADEDDVMTLTNINENDAETFIINLKNRFDYLIVDGTDRPNDVLVYTAFKQSDHVVEIVKPNVMGLTYHNAHMVLVNKIIDPKKYTFIFNGYQGYVNIKNILENCIGEPSIQIPFVQAFIEKENTGEVYKINKKSYIKEIKAFVNQLEEK